MAITKERRTQLIADYRRDEQDTGSPEVQIALLTARILELTEHMKLNKQDHASRRGLLRMVNQRTSLLGYLRTTERKRYQTVIERLGLRK